LAIGKGEEMRNRFGYVIPAGGRLLAFRKFCPPDWPELSAVLSQIGGFGGHAL
jgi:hypothetical protein